MRIGGREVEICINPCSNLCAKRSPPDSAVIPLERLRAALIEQRKLVLVDGVVVEMLVALRTSMTRRLVAALYFAMVSPSTSVSILLAPLELLLALCITFLRSESAGNPHSGHWWAFGDRVWCGQV